MQNRFSLSIGWMFITVAVVFILSATGVIVPEISKLLISWQALIVIIGKIKLLNGHFTTGSILILTGLYFIIPKACDVFGLEPIYSQESLLMIFLAILLLIIGLWCLFRMNNLFQHRDQNRLQGFIGRFKPKNPTGLPTIECAFGEINHTAIEKPFKGAKIAIAFGGGKLDLQKTTLPEGDTIIDLACAFGGIQIIVPPNFVVLPRITPVFGGVDDKREPTQDLYSDRRLILQGTVAFGGVEILNGSLFPDVEKTEEEEDILESVSVKQHNKVHIIPVHEIQYIQSDGDYVTICSIQGRFLKDQTMKYFQSALPADRFLRIHRSYIVNISEISSVDTKGKETYFVILKDGTSLRASSGGYQSLKQKLNL